MSDPGFLTKLETAIQVTAHQAVCALYEFVFVLWSCPELIPPMYRLWEHSLRISPYTLFEQEPPTTPSPEVEMTYGEILLPTVDKLFHKLALGPDDHIIDLGAGRGRIVMLAAARGIPATGVELLQTLVDIATHATKGYLPLAQFKQGDICDADLSEASLIWFSGTCFLKETRATIAQRVVSQCKEGTHLISSSLPLDHPQLPVIEVYKGWTSWGRSPLYIQQLQQPSVETSPSSPTL